MKVARHRLLKVTLASRNDSFVSVQDNITIVSYMGRIIEIGDKPFCTFYWG